jgi:hypothetical protein
LHIGKTGGTAIKYALSQLEEPKTFDIIFCDHNCILRDIPRGIPVVFFLRDPLSRFVSGFRSRQRKGRPRYNVPWTQDEEAAFAAFRSARDLASSLSSADRARKQQAKKAMRSIQHVRDVYGFWLESVDYLCSRSDDIYFVGFQENLNDDFRRLLSKLGASLNIQLPSSNAEAHRNSYEDDDRLTESDARNIRHWYKDDYEIIDYLKRNNAG